MTKQDYNEKIINDAVEVLKNDGIIVIPTDTVYGMAVSTNSDIGLTKLYEIKKRNLSKKIPVIVDTYDRLMKMCDIDITTIKKLHPFFPGKLTIILNKRDSQETIAVRMINNEIINKIIYKLNCPLFLTSANISGQKECDDILDIIELFDGKIDMIIMGNKLSNKCSTIVKIEKNNLTLIREGAIPFEEIENTFYRS